MGSCALVHLMAGVGDLLCRVEAVKALAGVGDVEKAQCRVRNAEENDGSCF